MSACHQALFLIEVHERIFHELLQLGARATLAALARTCRAFHETAINVLWFRLENILPLLLCMPAVRALTFGNLKVISSHRALSCVDWEVFFKYSGRVRILAAEPHNFNVYDDMFCTLCAPPERRALLPRLQSLQWRVDIAECHNISILFLRALLTPTLTDLDLSYKGYSTSLENCLNIITSTCPSLKSFHIAYKHSDDTRLPEHHVVTSSYHLESVTNEHTSESVLRHLAYLPNLRCMNVGTLPVDLPIEWIANVVDDNTHPFPRLHHLSFKKSRCDPTVKFLVALRLNLQSFTCTFHRPSDVQPICNALVESARSDTLKTITLSCTNRRQVLLESVSPLYKFGNVTQFSINFRNLDTTRIDDNALFLLAKSWPYLEKLYLNWGGWKGKTGITHKGLIELLRHCQHMEELGISVDFLRVDEDTVVGVSDGEIVGSRCMFAAFLRSGSMACEPPFVISLLKALLPNLRGLILPSALRQSFSPEAINRNWARQEKMWDCDTLPDHVMLSYDDDSTTTDTEFHNWRARLN